MQSLERVIALIEAVATNQGSLTASVAANRVQLAPSSTSRLLREMADVGVLRKLDDGSYVLGARTLTIAGLAASPQGMLATIEMECARLRDLTGETVSLHVRSGTQRICFVEVQSTADVRRVVRVGSAMPLYSGATGRALLAGLSSEELDEYLTDLAPEPESETELRHVVDEVRRAGWNLGVDTWLAGVSGIAVPVPAGGRSFAALGVSGPSFRWDADAMQRHVPDVMRTAERIAAIYTAGSFGITASVSSIIS